MPELDSPLETTPEMHHDSKEPEPELKATGNSSSCYLCARSFHQLPQEYVVRREHEYSLDPDWTPRSAKGRAKNMVHYFVTYCLWCAHQFKL